jgi:hypothetical protein
MRDKPPQAPRLPTIVKVIRVRAARSTRQLENGTNIMWLIVLEAAGALLVLLLIVWWTMFSGRRAGELAEALDQAEAMPTQVPLDEGGSRGGNKKLKG